MKMHKKISKKHAAYRRGLFAEYRVAVYLILKGYRILAMRYKTPVGEIDLIARRGSAISFIEVKARPSQQEALEAVRPKAQERIARAAQYFIGAYPDLAQYSMRFDVAACYPPMRIHYLDNAWQVSA